MRNHLQRIRIDRDEIGPTQDHQQVRRGIGSHAVEGQQLPAQLKCWERGCFEGFEIKLSRRDADTQTVDGRGAVPHPHLFLEDFRAAGGNDSRSGKGAFFGLLSQWSTELVDQLAGHVPGRRPQGVGGQDGLDHILEQGWRAQDAAEGTRFEARQLRLPARSGVEA